MGERRLERVERSLERGERRRETGDRIRSKGMGDVRHETEDVRQ